MKSQKSMLVAVSVVIVAFIGLSLERISTASHAETSFQYDEQSLIERALQDSIQVGGLKSTGDAASDRDLVKLTTWTTLGEWDAVTGAAALPDANKFGVSADMPVLIVVIRGQISDDAMPGAPSLNQSKGPIYDNKYVIMDPNSGRVIGSTSFGPGYSLPLYPQETIAGGATAVFNPEATTDVLPLP